MTTTTEGLIVIRGSGLRGAKRAAAKSHNARLRAALRPRNAAGQFVSAFEAMVTRCPGTVPEGMVHVDQLEIEGGWVHADDGTTHGHTRCRRLVGVEFHIGDAAECGWLCAVCVHVPNSIRSLTHDIANTHGVQTCDTCDRSLPMTKFPTYVDSGWRMRGRTCRRCRDGRVAIHQHPYLSLEDVA